ncbi:RIP metalloprotease RseP [Falsirhodobacter sp. 20TX0035]|uniref:RIP metalloprotease RseP n=1 Tax=Falsirhodobacter sp. 20TX0035 TaxID=3022019 RepID=UPI00232E1563|nr:RIP metalloprotease RseP [Falsirhodobacter sp. 20TX0035]MDB6453408.1 RIP metalloprotease RseP [Falsirhodobacter sp. 20TX0035]
MDIAQLIPQFGGLIWTLLAFVVALSVIVTIHEYGHYIVGRWSGIHAEVFSLGFGPVIFARTDRRGTRWQLALLPLGGYVRFKGDADAASAQADASIAHLPPEERRRTLPGAPLWARAATVAAGPAFNFLFAILVFAGVTFTTGIAVEDAVVGQVRATPGQVDPLRPGDRILSMDGRPVNTLGDAFTIAADLPPSDTTRYEVERDGQRLTLQGPFPFPPIASSVAPTSAAQEAGLQIGDVITAVNGQPVRSFTELRERIGATDGQPVTLSVWNGTSREVSLTPKRQDIPTADGGFETRWLIGVTGGLIFDPETRRAGPLEALELGARQSWTIVTTSLSGMWHMVTGAISTCNLQGPIGIAETSGAAASGGAQSFVWFLAVLSVAVGLMNLFPIPVLDGGHLVFYAAEAVLRRPPNPRVVQAFMTVGLALILGLMVFALSNDILCP